MASIIYLTGISSGGTITLNGGKESSPIVLTGSVASAGPRGLPGRDGVDGSSDGSGVWGLITGQIGNQTDLQTEFDTKMAVSANLGDVPNPTAARSNLGLAIGTNVEAYVPGTSATDYLRGDKTYANFNTAVQANRLNELSIPSGSVNLSNQKLTNLQTPTLSSDAANKGYVDSVAQGLSVKTSVVAATNGALPTNTYAANVITETSSGSIAVDGVTLSNGDRVLVKNEASANKNGIYTVTDAGSVSTSFILTRSTDMDTGSEVSGAFTFVTSGTTNANTGWIVSTAGPFTIGTSSINFTQFSSSGVPDATTSIKGKVQLAGDLGGTASAPTTPTAVHLTGNETIAGVKTFTGTVTVPTPVNATDASTKAYVDKPRSVTRTVGMVGMTADYICDGVSDDVQLLQAWNDVVALGGGVVHVRIGTYDISQTLVLIGSNMIFEGEGPNTKFVLAANVNREVICLGNAVTAINNVTFRDFQIDGNKSNQPVAGSGVAGSERVGLRLRCDAQNCYFITVERVIANNTRHNGISVESPYFSTVRSCRAENNDQYGIWWENSGYCVIEGNFTRSNLKGGITAYSSGQGSISDNISASDQSTGLAILQSHDHSVTGNRIDRPGFVSGGTSTAATGIVVSLSKSITLTGNGVSGSYGHGSLFNGLTNSTVTNNTFRKNGQLTTNTYSDMVFDNSGGGSAVSDNTFTGNTFKNDTDVNSPNTAKYNLAVLQTSTHVRNTIRDNQFGTPATAKTLNLSSALVTADQQEVGNNGNLNPSKFHYYGYLNASQTLDWADGDYLKGAGYTTSTITIPDGIYRGQRFFFSFDQDSPGNKQLVWPSNVKWPNNAAPTLSTGANQIDTFVFIWDGTNWCGISSSNTPTATTTTKGISLLGAATGAATFESDALKAPIASPTFTGVVTTPQLDAKKTGTTLSGAKAVNINRTTPSTDAQALGFNGGIAYDFQVGRPANSDDLVMGVDGGSGFQERFRLTTGGKLTTLNGFDASNTKITSVATPTVSTDVATKGYVDTVVATGSTGATAQFVDTAGDTMTGALILSGAPSTGLQAATKAYVDSITINGGTA